jgi:hypothetical protein
MQSHQKGRNRPFLADRSGDRRGLVLNAPYYKRINGFVGCPDPWETRASKAGSNQIIALDQGSSLKLGTLNQD